MADRYRQVLRNLIQTMYDEGTLDIQFAELQSFQTASNPSFVSDVIKLFIEEVGNIISDLQTSLTPEEINFDEVMDSYVHQLKGCCTSIGALRLRNACSELSGSCNSNYRTGCIRALDKIRNEYQRLLPKLHTIIQLEETINSCCG